MGEENVDMANALYLLLGGTAITYYGEEIGMTDLPKDLLKFEDCQDEAGKRHGVIKIHILIFTVESSFRNSVYLVMLISSHFPKRIFNLLILSLFLQILIFFYSQKSI